MEPIVLGALPERLATWRGTAAELAAECNRLLANFGLDADKDAANERLLRHYVSMGILTPPERKGPDAGFGVRQVGEFIATRHLLRDGWSLAKIADLIRTAGPEGWIQVIEGGRERTAAEKALAKLRQDPADKLSSRAVKPVSTMATKARPTKPAAFPALPSALNWRALSVAEPSVDSLQPPDYGSAETGTTPGEVGRQLATAIAQRRLNLTKDLAQLGSRSGRPERSLPVRLELTPWCQVYVDPDELNRMPEEAADILGNALTHALQAERKRRGDKA